MFHTIIIPHRNRHAHLAVCLWSIERSGKICGRGDFEVLVVEHGSNRRPDVKPFPHVKLVVDRRSMGMLNKPRLQNGGIERAGGEVLTFLDADAVVGRRWIEAADDLQRDLEITRLCYRVRYLPQGADRTLSELQQPGELLDGWFADYDAKKKPPHGVEDKYRRGYEAYGNPEWNREECGQPIFGNSQFSIRREALGQLRYDEDYVGRGYEDLPMIRAIWRAHGKDYRGQMVTDGEHALFHLQHGYENQDWYDPEVNQANYNRYQRTQWDKKGKRDEVSRYPGITGVAGERKALPRGAK